MMKFKLSHTALILTLTASVSFAYPSLQPDVTNTYVVSAAIYPKAGPAGRDIGSVSGTGVKVNATANMHYGTPPIESVQTSDPGVLPQHDIYPSDFTQFAFNFDPARPAGAYAAQTHAGAGPTPDANGNMYYTSFDIDTSGLTSGNYVHRDLYDTRSIPITEKICSGRNSSRNCVDIVTGWDADINSFPPPPHDDQNGDRDHRGRGGRDGRDGSVPEPATMLLLGLALAGLGVYGKKRTK